jgi:hypothetical protein
MYDTSPDSIMSRIGRRDAELSSDWFFVGIDSYHDRRSGFYFGVNPGGSIQDGASYNDEQNGHSTQFVLLICVVLVSRQGFGDTRQKWF